MGSSEGITAGFPVTLRVWVLYCRLIPEYPGHGRAGKYYAERRSLNFGLTCLGLRSSEEYWKRVEPLASASHSEELPAPGASPF